MKRNIILNFAILMILNIGVITTIAIYFMYEKNQQDIEDFRISEIDELKYQLTNLIDLSYDLILHGYQKTQNDTFLINFIKKELLTQDSSNLGLSDTILLNRYRQQAQDVYMKQVIQEISTIRYDDGKGYFWITDNQLPFPIMINHPIRPEENGKITNDAKYNTEKGTNKNIEQARAEICNTQGSGYVEYQINKPGSKEFESKISFSRLFQPLGWIISTGLYTDQIEKAVATQTENLNRQVRNFILIIVLISLFLIGLGIWIAERFSQRIILAVHAIQEKLKKLSLGQKVPKLTVNRKDEIKEMTDSLNALVDGIDSYVNFAKEVGEGRLDSPFQLLSEEDTLGNALLTMRRNLKVSYEEDNTRKWIAESIARFGEVLRKNNTDLKVLGDEVLRFLMEHIKINQGAVYILEENEESENVLNLFACYAYNRKKFLNKHIEIGDGLVGQCYLEKKSIYLLSAPENYVHIKSGLGDAPPNNIFIVPLVNNESCYGVLELATFHQLEAHETSFIEDVSGSLASTINTVKINERTHNLLQKSQKMGEELRAQEEELRQNQEEMQSTQEEMKRRYDMLFIEYQELAQENEALKNEQAAPAANGSTKH